MAATFYRPNGAKMATNDANVFMQILEQNLVFGYHPRPPHYYKYIDEKHFNMDRRQGHPTYI